MANPQPTDRCCPTVSPQRKAVSFVVLLLALVILGVELRAGFGQSSSGKALAAVSTNGVFDKLPLADAQALLSMAPTETVIRENKNEKVYQYHWTSFLRPLMGKPQPELFLVSTPTDPPIAIAYYTDPDDAQSGFYGDAVPAEEPTGELMPTAEDAFGIPEAVPAPSDTGSDAADSVGGAATELPAEKTQP